MVPLNHSFQFASIWVFIRVCQLRECNETQAAEIAKYKKVFGAVAIQKNYCALEWCNHLNKTIMFQWNILASLDQVRIVEPTRFNSVDKKITFIVVDFVLNSLNWCYCFNSRNGLNRERIGVNFEMDWKFRFFEHCKFHLKYILRLCETERRYFVSFQLSSILRIILKDPNVVLKVDNFGFTENILIIWSGWLKLMGKLTTSFHWIVQTDKLLNCTETVSIQSQFEDYVEFRTKCRMLYSYLLHSKSAPISCFRKIPPPDSSSVWLENLRFKVKTKPSSSIPSRDDSLFIWSWDTTQNFQWIKCPLNFDF